MIYPFVYLYLGVALISLAAPPAALIKQQMAANMAENGIKKAIKNKQGKLALEGRNLYTLTKHN